MEKKTKKIDTTVGDLIAEAAKVAEEQTHSDEEKYALTQYAVEKMLNEQ